MRQRIPARHAASHAWGPAGQAARPGVDSETAALGHNSQNVVASRGGRLALHVARLAASLPPGTPGQWRPLSESESPGPPTHVTPSRSLWCARTGHVYLFVVSLAAARAT